MKKRLLTLIVLASSLCTFAQWTAFPGSGVTSISCGSADQLVCTAVGNIYRFNFNTNQWGLLASALSRRDYIQASVAADGTVWGVLTPDNSTNTNLMRSIETPAVVDQFMSITGVLSNISVSSTYYAIGSEGGGYNNIYFATTSQYIFTQLSSNFSSYMTVVGNDGSIWTITNTPLNVDNVYKYTGSTWVAVPGIRASYIAVGDANKVLIVSGGEIYYLSSTQQWVKDLNSPTGISKVTVSSSGHAYAMTSVGGANNVRSSTWCQIVDGVIQEVSILPEGNVLNVNGVFSAYEWFNVANPTEVLATTESFEVLENGVYKVRVTNQAGCSAESEPLAVEVLNITNTNSLKGFELYPNPASDFINFEKPAGYDLRFYDVVGNEINQIKTLEGKATINVENLPEGIYFLRMTNQYEALVEKIVIKR